MTAVVAAAYGNRFATAANYTPTSTLTTPTYDASGVTTEPTWIRKPSWVTATGTDLLAHNPLTGGSAAVENPSILISNDNGSTWTTPSGVTNPIAPAPASGTNADCHLFADPNANRLVMSWNVSSNPTGNQNGIWYSICTDPTLVTWSAPAQLVAAASNAGLKEQEPKILWDTVRGKYLLYYADLVNPLATVLYLRVGGSTSPISGYGTATACSLTIPGGQQLWHMDIIQESSGRFVMALCDSNLSGSYARQGWLAVSWDGLTWKCAPRPFMKVNSWATLGVYRPSIQPARSGSGYDLIVSRHQVPTAQLGLIRNLPKTEVP